MTTSTPATTPTRDRSRLRAAAKILVFDTAPAQTAAARTAARTAAPAPALSAS